MTVVAARAPVTPGGAAVRRGVRACLVAGPAGALAFVAGFTVDGALRPGYDALVQPVSALALGPHGWVQDVAFAAFAVCIACFGRGLRASMPVGAGSRSVPLTAAAAAVCLTVLAACPQDPVSGYEPGRAPAQAYTGAGLTHITASAVVATLFVLHCALMARHFRRTSGGVGRAATSAVAACLGAGLVVAYIVLCEVGGPSGLLERGAVVVMAVHSVLVARWFARPGGVGEQAR